MIPKPYKVQDEIEIFDGIGEDVGSNTYNIKRATYKDALEFARQENLIIRYPGPNDLYIDLDTDKQKENFEEILPFFVRMFPVFTVVRTPSKSGGTHVVVTLERPDGRVLDNIERIAFQAILGSDPKRELFSLIRARKYEPCPTLFFERRVDSQEKVGYTGL